MTSTKDPQECFREFAAEIPELPTSLMAVNVDDLPEEDLQEPNWNKPSLAVIASDGDDGWVMFCVGAHLDSEIDNVGTRNAEDLGIIPPSAGVWIWEGKYVGYESHGWDGPEYDTEPHGSFRQPTDEEWAAIRTGTCPWNPDDWLLPVEKTSNAQCSCQEHPFSSKCGEFTDNTSACGCVDLGLKGTLPG